MKYIKKIIKEVIHRLPYVRKIYNELMDYKVKSWVLEN